MQHNAGYYRRDRAGQTNEVILCVRNKHHTVCLSVPAIDCHRVSEFSRSTSQDATRITVYAKHGSAPPNSRTAEQHTDPHHNIFAQTCSGPQGKLNTSGCSHDLCAPFPPVTCMIPPSPCESAARFAYISPLLAAYTQTWSKPTSDGRDGCACTPYSGRQSQY